MRYALLEPLRGLAALWVFCFHFGFSEQFQQSFPFLHSVFKLGHLGVPMFFVLSGYCITASAKSAIRHNEATANFLYRRVRRIYPPYWFSILVVAALPFVIEFISSLKTGHYTAPTASLNYGYLNYNVFEWFSVASLVQAFANVPGATTLQAKFTTINAVYWTLAIEVQFYLVMTLALVARRYFYPLLLVVTLVSLPLVWIPATNTIGIFLPYWPMFAVGIGLYRLFELKLAPSQVLRPALWPYAAVASLLILVLFIVYAGFGGTIHHLAFAALFGVFLYFGECLDRFFTAKIEPSRNFAIRCCVGLSMAVGAMSYSLYLLHGRLQHLVKQIVRQVLPTNSIAFDFSVIAITCALCYVFYLFCERPFMSVRQRALVELSPKLPAAETIESLSQNLPQNVSDTGATAMREN